MEAHLKLQTGDTYQYNLGIALAAVLRTYGDMSDTASFNDSIIMGTITGTRILDSTRNALARISWFGSCKKLIFKFKIK